MFCFITSSTKNRYLYWYIDLLPPFTLGPCGYFWRCDCCRYPKYPTYVGYSAKIAPHFSDRHPSRIRMAILNSHPLCPDNKACPAVSSDQWLRWIKKQQLVWWYDQCSNSMEKSGEGQQLDLANTMELVSIPVLNFVQFRFQQWVLSSPGEIDLWPALKSSNMLDWMPALPSLISFRNLLVLQCSRPFAWAQLHWQLKDIERISNFPIFTFASLGRVVLSLTVQWTVFTCKEYQTLSTLSWLIAVFHCSTGAHSKISWLPSFPGSSPCRRCNQGYQFDRLGLRSDELTIAMFWKYLYIFLVIRWLWLCSIPYQDINYPNKLRRRETMKKMTDSANLLHLKRNDSFAVLR